MKKLQLTFALAVLCLQSCNKENLDQKFERESIEFTKENCPQDIDPYTTLDSAYYNPETKTYTFYHTVKDFMDNDTIYTEPVIEEFRSYIIDELRSSISLKKYKDCGITFAYQYFSDKSGKSIVYLEFPKEDYQ